METCDSTCIAKIGTWIQRDKYFWNKEQIEFQFDKNVQTTENPLQSVHLLMS